MSLPIRNPKCEIRNMHSRRAVLRLACGGAVGFAGSSWLSAVAAHAAQIGRKYKSCILLFMRGGPTASTFDQTGHRRYRGPYG
jgi:uncharacterized protein (DUF1501 family)